ncbi:MAG: hypothetical protein ACJ8LV_00080 [Chthoniobacterales bacterium]
MPNAAAVDTLAAFEAGRLARLQESGDGFGFYLLFSHGSANLLHFADIIDRIHLLDVHRFDVFKAQRIQAFAGELSILAGVGE